MFSSDTCFKNHMGKKKSYGQVPVWEDERKLLIHSFKNMNKIDMAPRGKQKGTDIKQTSV